jgi:hypothetical protein
MSESGGESQMSNPNLNIKEKNSLPTNLWSYLVYSRKNTDCSVCFAFIPAEKRSKP